MWASSVVPHKATNKSWFGRSALHWWLCEKRQLWAGRQSCQLHGGDAVAQIGRLRGLLHAELFELDMSRQALEEGCPGPEQHWRDIEVDLIYCPSLQQLVADA